MRRRPSTISLEKSENKAILNEEPNIDRSAPDPLSNVKELNRSLRTIVVFARYPTALTRRINDDNGSSFCIHELTDSSRTRNLFQRIL
jgi:hypothetical protein